jgi:hypothetical protein
MAKSLDQERVANDVVVPTSLETRASEQTVMMMGKLVRAKFLRACSGSVMFSIVGRGCQHQPDPPPWSEMVSIAETIIGRIAQRFDGTGN